ncbi:hypothetical protein IAE16_05210 [Hydrogenobacter sp. T-2]|uniref:hypothetical protein n=1 Tax=Pampinifervens diazotrophicum TaxID=1632018 RepID=UPI002B262DE1|nr:hypothetical protein [Hydrogenobacter sp. T-2]WPM31225.1 hypothetical protein IAE16_05210 [Hydrogenobacter sp. T-2]
MIKWTLDLTELKQDMVETLDYWTGLLIYPLPFPHATVYWDFERVQEHGKLFWIDRLAFKHHYLYGEGELPELREVIYWIPLSKEELMPFLSEDRLVIEVYETAEGMDGDIVVAVNSVPVARSNKRLLVEKAKQKP